MVNRGGSIEKEIIVPYLQEHPEELEKLTKRLMELKPLAAEFLRCHFLLKQFAEEKPNIKQVVTDEDVQKIIDILNKTF